MASWPMAFNEVKPCIDLLIVKVVKKLVLVPCCCVPMGARQKDRT